MPPLVTASHGVRPNVSEGSHHFENLAAGWKHPATGPLVGLERPHEFEFIRRVVTFAGGGVDVPPAGTARQRSSAKAHRTLTTCETGLNGGGGHGGISGWVCQTLLKVLPLTAAKTVRVGESLPDFGMARIGKPVLPA